MIGQTRIVDLAHERVAIQVLGDGLRVLAVLAHTHGERLDATQDEPAIERRGDTASRVLVKLHLAVELLVRGQNRAADDVAVPVEVLGRAVDDDVRAEVERLLQRRRGEGVVHDEQRIMLAGDTCDGGDVHQGQQRVRRRLDPDHLRLGRIAAA